MLLLKIEPNEGHDVGMVEIGPQLDLSCKCLHPEHGSSVDIVRFGVTKGKPQLFDNVGHRLLLGGAV